jgi:hypothetical protein
VVFIWLWFEIVVRSPRIQIDDDVSQVSDATPQCEVRLARSIRRDN